ncbi:MAG: DoxX family protein [Parcubacteria group bacterium]|nr:DoxX family protein [Parcubacteria group bacterium]
MHDTILPLVIILVFMNQLLPWGPLLARIFIGGLFLISGIAKLTGFAGVVAFAESTGIPAASLAIILAILVEVLGGLSVLLGYKIKVGATLLAIFAIATAILFHADFADQAQQALFMKNFAIAGGLLYMVRFGAGKMAIEK